MRDQPSRRDQSEQEERDEFFEDFMAGFAVVFIIGTLIMATWILLMAF